MSGCGENEVGQRGAEWSGVAISLLKKLCWVVSYACLFFRCDVLVLAYCGDIADVDR